MPQRRSATTWWQLLAVVAIGVVAAAGLVLQAHRDSLTYDESGYLFAGACAVRTGVIDRIDISNPPLFKLAAGVAVVAVDERTEACDDPVAAPRPPGELRRMIVAARLPSVAAALFGLVVLAAWVRALAGPAAALVATAITAVEPTVVGHGHLATGEVWLTTAVVSTLAAHWSARRARTRPATVAWAALAGAALGVGLLSKVSALALLPVLLLLELLGGDLRRRIGAVALRNVTVLLAAAIVLWLPYLVTDHRAAFEGRTVADVDKGLPGSWVAGLEFQLDHARAGAGDSNWFLGEARPGARIPAYYVTALALKGSPILVVGTIAALALSVVRRHRRADALANFALPAAIFLAVPSAGVIHIGFRYVLPALPLLAAWVAAVVTAAATRRGAGRALAAGTVLLLLPSVAALRGSGISYFNLAAGRQPERLLADSNIDWGQDAWRVRSWWTDAGRPDVVDRTFSSVPLRTYGIDAVATGGCGDLVVVSAHRRVLGDVPPLGPRVVRLTPATSVYRHAC